jgi:hypothetical protein
MPIKAANAKAVLPAANRIMAKGVRHRCLVLNKTISPNTEKGEWASGSKQARVVARSA